MPTKFGLTSPKILVQNLKNNTDVLTRVIEERDSIPSELYNKTNFFATQDRINRLTLDCITKIQTLLDDILHQPEDS